jgi:TetR/AcrR family transcriptional regulator, cholesterol catabolism regulator
MTTKSSLSGASRKPGRKQKTFSTGPVDESARDRVMRLSAELFAEQGFDATGIRDIEAAVGLGRGALYYHIGSKDELLTTISISSLQRLLDRSEPIVASTSDAEVKLRRIAVELFDHFLTEGASSVVALTDVRSLSPEMSKAIHAARDQYEDLWRSVFAQGAEESGWRPVSPILRRGILGMFRSVRLWLRAGALSPQEIADSYIDLILSGLKSP